MRLLFFWLVIAFYGDTHNHVNAQKDSPWPQGAGPEGNWHVQSEREPPISWSVARNENILWRTKLPNAGQGGIAVSRDKLFLTTFPEQQEGRPRQNQNVLGICLDRASGTILWTVSLPGDRPSPQLYAFSDATSWSPICDEDHVWFFNSSGRMGCWDHQGKEIWVRVFRTQPSKYPFNRQCEPMLSGDSIITVEPMNTNETRYEREKDDWNYLHAIDRTTGKVKWISEDPCTFYCTPCLGYLANGNRAIVHGRGGPHGVPEIPIGISMTSLAKGEEGKTLWRFVPAASEGAPLDGTTWMALYNMVWNEDYVCWFRNAPEESHIVLDASDGKLLHQQSLVRSVDWRYWNQEASSYRTLFGVDLRGQADPTYPLKSGEVLHVLPQWHSNVMVNDWHWFLCSTNNRRNRYAPKGHSGPPHCLGRVHLMTGKTEYLELPVGIENANSNRKPLFGRSLKTETFDFRGREIAEEERSRTDGWEVNAFVPSPIAIDQKIYMSVMLGLTYVIDGKAKELTPEAILSVNDLGVTGETWSLSGPSFADGFLYHRSSKEIVAIGKR